MAHRYKKKLGEILLDKEKIAPGDLIKALAEQKTRRGRLGSVLIRMGTLTEKEIMEVLSDQLGIPIVSLYEGNIPAITAHLIPKEFAAKLMVIPYELRGNVLRLAMVDPLDIVAIDEVTSLLRREVEPCITTKSDMKWALQHYYGTKSLIETTVEYIIETQAEEPEEEEAAEDLVPPTIPFEEPVVKLVNSLLAQAMADGASDIHIEPMKDSMRIRMRMDGRLHASQPPPKHLLQSVISRLKIMGNLDIAKTRVPQDGRFDLTGDVSVRVSTYPSMWGEKAVLRLLYKNAPLYGIEKLGLLSGDEEELKKVLKRAYGFLLSTGPTGSGKTTTLYAILNYLNSEEKNIITIEDPVEYTLESVTQAQVNQKAGLTFEAGLRSMLRQDPDIIMVGEVRDRETAGIAVHAALTGHVVLSTFHTNDAAGALTRLVEMGIEPFLVASSVSCVVGQRLLRKICDDCRESFMPPPAVLQTIGVNEVLPLYRGKGCPSCRGTGYRGRTGVFETLVVDDEIRALIVNKAPTETLKKKAIEHGMREMRDDAIRKALMCITTLEEALNTTQLE